MTPALTPLAIALLAFCIGAEVARELCFKAGADHAMRTGARGYASRVLREPLVWIGVFAWAVELVAWIAALRQAPLGIAYPIMTLTYAATPLAGVLVLRERLDRGQILGAALVFAGVAAIGWSHA